MDYKKAFKKITSILLIEVGTLLMALSVGLFILPDKILTEVYPDRTYPETANLNIDILCADK